MRGGADKPEDVQRGGLWINGACLTWPMAKIEFFPDHFRVQCARFNQDNLVALDEVWSGLGNGFHIRHTNPNAPKRLVFWPMSVGALRREFEQRGYRIERGGFAWALFFRRDKHALPLKHHVGNAP